MLLYIHIDYVFNFVIVSRLESAVWERRDKNSLNILLPDLMLQTQLPELSNTMLQTVQLIHGSHEFLIHYLISGVLSGWDKIEFK